MPRKASGLVSHHRGVQSYGGEASLARLSPLGGSFVTPSGGQPCLRPEHRTAVLLAAGGEGGVPQAPQLLPAEGASGPAAAWMLGGGMQQHLALPRIEGGQPATLWWRVTAGARGSELQPVGPALHAGLQAHGCP